MAVTSVSFSPDGKTLASASDNATIKLWNLDGHEPKTLIGHLGPVKSVNFSPDGKTVVSASEDNTIKLWSLDGQELSTLNGHSSPVNSVSFSPDGKTVVSASEDKTLILWNFNLDDLLQRGCNSLRDYLKTQPNNYKDTRHFCNGIRTSRS